MSDHIDRVLDASVKQDIWSRILLERARQDEKWGKARERNQTKRQWLTILMEEVGEVAEAILEGDDANYPVELVQVAAVCVAALEDWAAQEEREHHG